MPNKSNFYKAKHLYVKRYNYKTTKVWLLWALNVIIYDGIDIPTPKGTKVGNLAVGNPTVGDPQ